MKCSARGCRRPLLPREAVAEAHLGSVNGSGDFSRAPKPSLWGTVHLGCVGAIYDGNIYTAKLAEAEGAEPLDTPLGPRCDACGRALRIGADAVMLSKGTIDSRGEFELGGARAVLHPRCFAVEMPSHARRIVRVLSSRRSPSWRRRAPPR